MVLTDHASDLLSHIALRLVNTIEPYLVEQERMTNAQLLMYGAKHLGQKFFFMCFSKHESDFGAAEYRAVLSCFYEKSIKILK